MPAEENSPADCFRRRGQGASRREGIRQYAEKIPCSPPKMEKLYRKVWLFLFYLQRDSNKEGSGFACGRKQSCGLFSPTWSRSIATRRHTAVCRKNPLLINNCLLQYKNEQTIRLSARFVICFKYRRY